MVKKFGVRPQSIPDWLGLVGDAADGFPGIPGWGEKSAGAVLTKYEHLEAIPADSQTWGLSSSRAARLAKSLAQHWAEVLLFRKLATLREDVPLKETLTDLEWQGADARLKEVCHRLGDEKFPWAGSEGGARDEFGSIAAPAVQSHAESQLQGEARKATCLEVIQGNVENESQKLDAYRRDAKEI